MFQRFIALASASAILACCTSVSSAQQDVAQTDVAPTDVAQAAEPIGRAAQAHHVLATHAADAARSSMVVRRASKRYVVAAYAIAGDGSNGGVGTIQPGIGSWEQDTDRTSADRQINLPPSGDFTTATSNALHDAPSLAQLADGSVIEVYGAASTYPNYHPPASWACMPRIYCEPFKYSPASGGDIASDLGASAQYLLPSVGISEATSATIGDATIVAGQQQTLSPYGQTGAQGYVSLHASGGRATFDTAAGPYDFRAQRTPPGDGLQMVTKAPNDDAYVDFGIRSAGSGTISLALDGMPCSLNVGGASPEDAARQFVEEARATCPAFRTKYGIALVQYDPLERGALAIVGVTLRRGDVTTLPGAATVRLQCTGLTCGTAAKPDTVFDVRGSGLHRHFMFGGVMRLGAYVYDILDVQQVTGAWSGPGHNSYALALSCFRSSGARNGVWQWTDCSGRHPFTEAPGTTPVNRLGAGSPYLIGAPERGYDENMTPYIYDWSMAAQPPTGSRTYPVISAESAALDGKDLLVVHGCQLRDGRYGVCYARYDTAAGRTTRAGIVDAPAAGGSLATVALRSNARHQLRLAVFAGNGPKWGCSGSGPCAMTYSYDRGTNRWLRRDADSLGGANNAGFPGIVQAESNGFLFTLRDIVSPESRRIVTFEKAEP